MTRARMAKRRVNRRLGHRGSAMLTIAAVWAWAGAVQSTVPAAPATDEMLFKSLPPWARALLWIAPAAVATVAAFRPRGAPDGYGWLALYLLPAMRGVSSVYAWIASWDGKGGDDYGWLRLVVWLLIMRLIYVLARWPETVPPPSEVSEDDQS